MNGNTKIFIALALIAAFASGFVLRDPVSKIIEERSKPRVSIITSVWNGDEFIEGFMEDITKQTIFPQSELIMINANSPGNEEPVIKKYMEKYPNIVYVKLESDPGLYAVWNKAIRMAKSDYISNANLDDRSRKDALEILADTLDAHPELDLIYTGYLITETPNETYDKHTLTGRCVPGPFSIYNMKTCLPGPRPLWRKSMHDKYGYFDEIFVSGGDYAFWLRASLNGSKYLFIDDFTNLFYMNPKGLSTDVKDQKRVAIRNTEAQMIAQRYAERYQELIKDRANR